MFIISNNKIKVKNTHISQWNIKSQEINPHVHKQLIFHKGARITVRYHLTPVSLAIIYIYIYMPHDNKCW